MDLKKVRKQANFGVSIVNESIKIIIKQIKRDPNVIDNLTQLFTTTNLLITSAGELRYQSKKLDAMIELYPKNNKITPENITQLQQKCSSELSKFIENLKSLIEPIKYFAMSEKPKKTKPEAKQTVSSLADVIGIIEKLSDCLNKENQKILANKPDTLTSLKKQVKKKVGGGADDVDTDNDDNKNLVTGSGQFATEPLWIGGFQTSGSRIEHATKIELINDDIKSGKYETGESGEDYLKNVVPTILDGSYEYHASRDIDDFVKEIEKVLTMPPQELTNWLIKVNKLDVNLQKRVKEWADLVKDQIKPYINKKKDQVGNLKEKLSDTTGLKIGGYDSVAITAIANESNELIKEITEYDVELLMIAAKEEFLRLNEIKDHEKFKQELLVFVPLVGDTNRFKKRSMAKSEILKLSGDLVTILKNQGELKFQATINDDNTKIKATVSHNKALTDMHANLNKLLNFEILNKEVLQQLENSLNQQALMLEKLIHKWKVFLSPEQSETCIVPIITAIKQFIDVDILPKISKIRFKEDVANPEIQKIRDILSNSLFGNSNIQIYDESLNESNLLAAITILVS